MTAVTSHRRALAFLAGVMFLIATWAAPSGAQADDEPDHVVLAGAVAPDNPLKLYSYEDYFPRHCRCIAGSTSAGSFRPGSTSTRRSTP
jgi:hypothetical protein